MIKRLVTLTRNSRPVATSRGKRGEIKEAPRVVASKAETEETCGGRTRILAGGGGNNQSFNNWRDTPPGTETKDNNRPGKMLRVARLVNRTETLISCS